MVNLVSFKADKFASTMRPNAFENFNNFKFTIRLISYLEAQGVDFAQVLWSLKFLKKSDANKKNSYRLERQIRNRVLSKVLKKQSIVADIEQLFYLCFTYLVASENLSRNIGFKNYQQLVKLVQLYEPIIYKSNNMEEQEALIWGKAFCEWQTNGLERGAVSPSARS